MSKGGSVNMAEISKRSLPTLKERIRHFATTQTESDDVEVVLMVVSIHRYLMDPDFTTQTGLERDTEEEVYDIIVSDFTKKMKCLLDPALNCLVRKGELLAGSRMTMRLSDCSVYYNELELDADSLLIINKLGVVGSVHRDFHTDVIPYCGYPDLDTEYSPLVTHRGTYLALWNDVDLCGKYIDEQVALASPESIPRNRISIRALADTWKYMRRSSYPALLVKVIRKSRLRFYGKSNKFDKWPYQLYMTVADRSAVCSVVLWNELALELHSSLTEGAVLWMTDYTVKNRFQLMSRPTLRVGVLREVDIEVSLNKHHPQADVTLVDEEDVMLASSLPVLTYHFFSRQHLSSLPDQYNVDIIGVVTFVGRVERITKRVNSHQFWQYRWLELMDGTSPRPLRVQLFTTSQPQIHCALVPDTILVCTQMQLVHSLSGITSSYQQRTLYVTTTNESQVYVHTDDNRGQYHSPVVTQFFQWSRSRECQKVVKASMASGGYYSYPPLPTSLRGYQACFTGENPLTLVTGDRLTTELSSLCCHEHRRLTIQGFLVHIQFVMSVSDEHRMLRSKTLTPEQKKNSGRKRPHECLEYEASSMETVQPMSMLVDKDWRGVQGSVKTLCPPTAPSSFFRRQYSKTSKSITRSCLCMPACNYSKKKIQLEDLPKATSIGHFTITITSLNRQVALHAHFTLPDWISHNATVTGLLCGLGMEECRETEMYKPTPVDISNLLETGQQCHDKRMLFVLDLFRYRSDTVEVVLNRAFVIR